MCTLNLLDSSGTQQMCVVPEVLHTRAILCLRVTLRLTIQRLNKFVNSPPENVTEVRRFLGLPGYYSRKPCSKNDKSLRSIMSRVP